MSKVHPEELKAYLQAKDWADNGEIQAAFIVIEALWKNYPKHQKMLLSFLELFEEINFLKAYTLLGDILSGDEKWMEVLSYKSEAELSFLYEKHGLMALKLKDENTAFEQLKKASSLGRDSLLLWSTLSYLSTLFKDSVLACNAFWRALVLYKEPSLFEIQFCFLKKNNSQSSVGEDVFLNISLALFPQVSNKEAEKLLSNIKVTFPGRAWLAELQEIVAQEVQKVPIALKGEIYASFDKKNR